MKPSILATFVLAVMLASCDTPSVDPVEAQVFAPVQGVLETNCVHCHGYNRLSTMPPINDTHALTKLIGTHWIVPGKPEMSRFFQVVTFPDEIPGAMPPSGHAISPREVGILRDWIKAGAKVPAQNIKLHPQGPLPRSI
jgi:mono/diheme cytochrome c family protein